MKCKNKIALVTGGAGNGIGRSTALTLAREGAVVFINYRRSRENAEKTADYINNNEGKASIIQADIFNRDECKKMVDRIITECGKLDICIIGPGAGWNCEQIDKLDPGLSLKDIENEILPVYNLFPLILPHMYRNKWGRIIGLVSNPDLPSPSYSYNVAKGCRTEALLKGYKEAWNSGVTMNLIAPGPVNGIENFDEAVTLSTDKNSGIERDNITCQDIAEGILFLCSNDGRFVSGNVLKYMFNWNKK